MLAKQIVLFSILASSLHAVPVYIGTNTGGTSSSKGIYQADFDPETGKLTEPKLAAEYQSPGFLVQHPAKPVLLAVGAPGKPFADGSGSVAAFAIAGDQSLTLLGEVSSGGKDACHLAIDKTGRTVAVANYGDGKITTIRLDAKGVPAETASLVATSGSGPNKERQNGPHAHGVYFDNANARLFVPDLGCDRVRIYPFDAATSKLGDEQPPLSTVPGAGPRHMALSPDGKHAYVINELDSTILAATHESGAFKPLGTVSTLPNDFTGESTTAEIEVSLDGNFVYASNRGHDSIVVFRRDSSTGGLTFLQHAPCGGMTPRHFKIAPGGKWLLCAHQTSNTISVLPLDPKTGMLGAPGVTVAAPNPICLLFVH